MSAKIQIYRQKDKQNYSELPFSLSNHIVLNDFTAKFLDICTTDIKPTTIPISIFPSLLCHVFFVVLRHILHQYEKNHNSSGLHNLSDTADDPLRRRPRPPD